MDDISKEILYIGRYLKIVIMFFLRYYFNNKPEAIYVRLQSALVVAQNAGNEIYK